MPTDDQEQPSDGGPFGGLSASEAGRRGAESKRRAAEKAAEPVSSDERIVAALRARAENGEPAAAKLLLEMGALRGAADLGREQGMLQLLTPKQRACIETALRGDYVSQSRAVDAWCES